MEISTSVELPQRYTDQLEDGSGTGSSTTRTPATPQKDVPFFPYSVLGAGRALEWVHGEWVFDYSPEECFEIMKDYKTFLQSHLSYNEKKCNITADPQWIKAGEGGEYGTVGSQCQYAYELQGIVYWMVDEVTTLDEGTTKDRNGNKIYRFAMDTSRELTTPKMPMRSHGTRMVFTTFQGNPNKCHLKWSRHFKAIHVVGCVSLTGMFKNTFQGLMRDDMQNYLSQLSIKFSPKLPRKNAKIVVVGAGPSGLHMAHLLVERGHDPKSITFLEKSDRYGGKTVSHLDETSVQINNPKYNRPPNDCIQNVATCCAPVPIGNQPHNTPAERKRARTPNALQWQENYFEGGKPIYHELGTCYLSPGYYAIRTLLKDIQAQVVERSEITSGEEQAFWKELAEDDITREVYPYTYSVEEAGKPSYSFKEWFYQKGKSISCLAKTFVCTPRNGFMLTLKYAKIAYCKLHQELMDTYYYTLPPRPFPGTFEELSVPFDEFLKKHKLQTLIPVFTYGLTCQGYGVLTETPTFIAMQWLTPDLLDGYFEWYAFFQTLYKDSNGKLTKPIPKHLEKFDNDIKGMLVAGFGALWDRIVTLHDFGRPDEEEKCIKYNVDDLSITRIKRNGVVERVHVNYSQEGKSISEDFDFLIVAAPISDAYKDPTIKTLDLDLTPEEEDTFLCEYLKASTLRTTLFKPKYNGPHEMDHVRIFVDALTGANSGADGQVYYVRDSYKAMQPMLQSDGGDEYDPARNIIREKVCYQYVSPNNKFSDSELEDKLVDFFLKNNDYVDADDTTKNELIRKYIMKQQAWTYHTHYENEGLTKGKLWDILELQGNNKTLFVHASTNFESVLDLVNYNNMILDGIEGKLDDMLKPDADTRPDQWERPRAYLINNHTQWIKTFLNMFVGVIWTVWYIISYPVAELTWLRFQRRSLQKAFQTPKLGSAWSFSMKKFIDVSPTTRGFIDYRNGEDTSAMPNPVPEDFDPYHYDSEHKPGDSIYKVLMDPKFGFKKTFPSIANIPTDVTMQWNLTDLRVGIKWWLTTFKDGFQPLLGATAQSIIQNIGYYAPNFYSWTFSWIFASQFRLIIGYSYRFEDEKGGGLYIPDCNMLRTAVNEHGQEAGERICLTVCKVFTEEVLSSKKMHADFQPDFMQKDGCGYGCVVRMTKPVKSAYSSHNLYQFRTKAEEKEMEEDIVDLSW